MICQLCDMLNFLHILQKYKATKEKYLLILKIIFSQDMATQTKMWGIILITIHYEKAHMFSFFDQHLSHGEKVSASYTRENVQNWICKSLFWAFRKVWPQVQLLSTQICSQGPWVLSLYSNFLGKNSLKGSCFDGKISNP